jgi:hypothetical protein
MLLGRWFLARVGAVGTFALALVIAQGDSAQDGRLHVVKHGPVQPHRDEDGRLTHSKNAGVTLGVETSNWSGYEVGGYQATTTTPYTVVTATWTVPKVEYGQTKRSFSFFGYSGWEYSSTWVGVGGFCTSPGCSTVDSSLIQLGTEQDASMFRQTQYYAWIELLPANPIVISASNPTNCQSLSCANPVAPGDVITATLTCNSCTPDTEQSWTLTMTSNGAGSHHPWTYVTGSGSKAVPPITYESSLLTAVFIQEAPTGSGGVLPLAEPVAGAVDFTATSANGSEVSDLSLATNGIAMVNPAGQRSVPSQEASSGALSDEFAACWSYSSVTTTALQACTAVP